MIALGGVALPRGAQVFRTSTCSPDIAEFVLSIAALTGQAYAFYLPFIRRPEEAMSGGEGKGGEDDDTEGVGAGVWKDQPPSQEEMLTWMAEFPREYDDSMARRRMMSEVPKADVLMPVCARAASVCTTYSNTGGGSIPRYASRRSYESTSLGDRIRATSSCMMASIKSARIRSVLKVLVSCSSRAKVDCRLPMPCHICRAAS